jgi:hypothetical protein
MLKDKRKRSRKRERADIMWEGQVRGKRTSMRWEMHANGVTAAALTHIHEGDACECNF